MKKLGCILGIAFACFVSSASTWTIHGAKDNWLMVFSYDPRPDSTYGTIYDAKYALWDWTFDQSQPPGDSGYIEDQPVGGGVIDISEWRESWTFDLGGSAWWDYVELGSPGPEYLSYTNAWQSLISAPGEYWIDFDSDTRLRVSTTQPYDFGKWAWDGSINPSWVEPLAPKKQHGKGHGK